MSKLPTFYTTAVDYEYSGTTSMVGIYPTFFLLPAATSPMLSYAESNRRIVIRAPPQAGARVQQVVDALAPYGLTLQNYASISEQHLGGFFQARTSCCRTTDLLAFVVFCCIVSLCSYVFRFAHARVQAARSIVAIRRRSNGIVVYGRYCRVCTGNWHWRRSIYS